MINFIFQYQDLLINVLVMSIITILAEKYRRWLYRLPKTSQLRFEDELRNEFKDLEAYLIVEDKYENVITARDYFISKWKRLIKYDTLKNYEDQIFDIIKRKNWNNEQSETTKETNARRGET